jgi:mannose-6-phosphate isomerase-like protein (cupin superfamily)
MSSLQDRGRRDRFSGPPLPATARVVGAGAVLGADTGFGALEQSVLECEPGRSLTRNTEDCEEVLFVLSGEGVLHAGGESHALESETGAYVGPGEDYEVAASEGLRAVVVRVPDPVVGEGPCAAVRRLADQQSAAATTQREFRIVADPASGLGSATHFVGYIPPVRAPEHFHTYDEVIYVLDGEGVMHFDGAEHPVAAGSSIQLPARTVHCLENTGETVMRIVAVFRPAGSPAEAYYPDGTPAFGENSTQEER